MTKVSLLVFLTGVICCLVLVAGRPQDLPADEDAVYADEAQPQGLRHRHERDSLYASSKGKHGKLIYPVGPVRTFVKTDYHGNFKWGVRHIAGKK